MAKKKKQVTNRLRGHKKPRQQVQPRANAKKKKRNTPEQQRGGQFTRHLTALLAIRKNNQDGKPFNKRMLADWLRDEFDRDLDDLSAWYAAAAAARGDATAATPAGLASIQEASRDRNAERAIKSLQRLGLEIKRTDEFGKPYKKKPKTRSGKKSTSKKTTGDASSIKVWWTYDSKGPVSTNLERLFTNFKLTGYELEGIMGCNALLENFYGLPMQEKVVKTFGRITSHVPPRLFREAADQGAVWRFMFRRPGKYEPKKKLLREWNDATILRKQCTMTYAPADVAWIHYLTPDALPAQPPRRIAAYGTIFHAEEDSIYLVAAEPDTRDPQKWQRPVLYKFDRVIDLRMEDDDNPILEDIPSHARIKTKGKGIASRLDLEALFTDSIGAFFNYRKTQTVVVRIHSPTHITRCLERPFHRRQHVEIGPGKNEITLTIDSCFLKEVLPRLLAMEDGFTVEQPQELAQAIHDMANEMASRHNPGPQAGSRKA